MAKGSQAHPSDAPREPVPPSISRRIQDWKQRLIDLSRRNRLLHFHETRRGQLRVASPNPEDLFRALAIDEASRTVWLPPEPRAIESASAHSGNRRTPAPSTRPTDSKQIVCESPSREDLVRTLKNLQGRSDTDFAERGVRILFVTFGELTWREAKDAQEEIRSPLVLIPVQLRDAGRTKPRIEPIGEDPVINPALRVKLHRDFRLELPEEPEDWDSVALSKFLEEISRAVSDTGWKVQPTSWVGLFAFYKLVIYEDLSASEAALAAHPITAALAGEKSKPLPWPAGPSEHELDDRVDLSNLHQVADADSSQQVCIQFGAQARGYRWARALVFVPQAARPRGTRRDRGEGSGPPLPAAGRRRSPPLHGSGWDERARAVAGAKAGVT